MRAAQSGSAIPHPIPPPRSGVGGRLVTGLNGISSTSAFCLYVNTSISFRTTTCRTSAGNQQAALRTASLISTVPAARAGGRIGIEGQFAAELAVGAEPAEHEIGVGDGWLRAAAAVAGRARHRLGAFRSDAQRAALVDPGDRSAAGADRVDVDDRDADR